jgi:hypothetical protein
LWKEPPRDRLVSACLYRQHLEAVPAWLEGSKEFFRNRLAGKPLAGPVTPFHRMTSSSPSLFVETSGPAGTACENLAVLSRRVPSTVVPMNLYRPCGNRLRSSSSGTSSSDGSAPSKNSSVRPNFPKPPLVVTSKILSLFGWTILSVRQSSPSRKT